MKKILISALAATTLLVACSEKTTQQDKAYVPAKKEGVIQEPDPEKLAEAEKTAVKQEKVSIDIDKYEFMEMLDAGNVTVLDVRTASEFADGHVNGAINIDYNSATFKDDVNKLDKTIPVLYHCQSGGRSSNAKPILESCGFVALYHLSDGYKSLD